MSHAKHRTLIALGASVAVLAVEAAGPSSELRAALWADAWHEGFQTRSEVSNVVATVRAANCNTIFLQVRKRGDTYYQGTPFEPATEAVKPVVPGQSRNSEFWEFSIGSVAEF